jgi:hypothetical protein
MPIWLILITGLSLAPFRVKHHLGATGMWHTGGHILVFLITTVLICSGAEDKWTRAARTLVVLLFAILCEWLELAVYGNFRFEWHDVRIDWIGVALGFVVASVAHQLAGAKKRVVVGPEGFEPSTKGL